MNPSNLVFTYGQSLKAAGVSPQTLRLRLYYLHRLEAAFPDQSLLELSQIDLADFMAQTGWQPETRRSARSSLKGFYRWAVEMELLPRDPSRSLPNVAVPLSRPRPAPEAVLVEAMASADQRGRLMMLLAAFAGLRRGEIAGLHTDDLLAGAVRIRGKGGRIRAVPLHQRIIAELHGIEPGWVFPNGRGHHLTPGHVGTLMKRLLGPGWSAHTLRHRFASDFFRLSKDILVTQQMLGHSKPETTARYVLVDQQVAASVVARLGAFADTA